MNSAFQYPNDIIINHAHRNLRDLEPHLHSILDEVFVLRR